MELRPAEPAAVAELRDEKLRTYHVPLLPNFHIHLAHHADTYEIRDEASSVGYALLLIDRHEGHDHVSLVEAYLTPPYRDRYEDALTAIKEEFRPQAYLARSDDCVFQTALIAMGHQMEISMAVMVARATYPPPDRKDLGLAPLDYAYLRPAHDIYVHSRGVQQAPTYSELEAEMQYDRYWVLTEGGQAVGLLVREESQGTRYCLLDIMAPHQPDEPQVWALRTVARDVEGEGLTCAAVVDARDPHKIELFRQAGYYTASTYLVFYDAEAGRPSVPVISRDELWELVQSGAGFHLIDVLGKDHWQKGHLPGADWLDFRSLTREARKRFKKDERIVVYCNDYT
jgi:hypothetical protein